jgi:drug/metabolite transporter (DMT)-like permease
MSSTALGLVLAAALIHAGWNLWMKRAGTGGGMVFVWGTAVVAAIVFAPLAWLAGAPEAPRALARPGEWPASIWLAVAVSTIVHTAYLRVLQRGYGAGDLSIVYPVARGTGPLLAAVAAIVWLGEPAGVRSLSGLALVVAGTFTIAGGGAILRAGASPAVRHGLAWGLATGVLIALYTVNDGRAVAALGADPLVYYWAICVAQSLLLAPWIMRAVPAWRSVLAGSWRVVLGVGVLSPVSYLLVLEAMRLAPVSVVAPARELSMLVAALAGATLLGEGQLGRRLAGSALIAAGVALLATAR